MDEWEQIKERFQNTRYYIPLMVGFYTGLRISEAFALTWDDIDLENRTLTVNKQVIKRNFGAEVRKVVEKKGKKEMRSSWYFATTKTEGSNRTVPFGQALYEALKAEKLAQQKNELKYGEFYTIHVLKKELDEKGNDMYRIVPIQKCVGYDLPRTRLICIAENGQYTSTDSFKYASRIIHHELKIGFDYHSLRHTHATMLIEGGANVKNVQARLGLKPAFISSIMSSVLSERLLSEVTNILSANFSATAAISGRLLLSLSPPQPNTQTRFLFGAMSLSVLRTFSRASGVWA